MPQSYSNMHFVVDMQVQRQRGSPWSTMTMLAAQTTWIVTESSGRPSAFQPTRASWSGRPSRCPQPCRREASACLSTCTGLFSGDLARITGLSFVRTLAVHRKVVFSFEEEEKGDNSIFFCFRRNLWAFWDRLSQLSSAGSEFASKWRYFLAPWGGHQAKVSPNTV